MIQPGATLYVKPDAQTIMRGCRVKVERVTWRGGKAFYFCRAINPDGRGKTGELPAAWLVHKAPAPVAPPKVEPICKLPPSAIPDWIASDIEAGWKRPALERQYGRAAVSDYLNKHPDALRGA